MPKRKRHQPGKYKPKPEIGPNFIGTKPLDSFPSRQRPMGSEGRQWQC